MRQDYVVEIQPDGRAALRIVIVEDEYPPTQKDFEDAPERGVVEFPIHEENPAVITWEM